MNTNHNRQDSKNSTTHNKYKRIQKKNPVFDTLTDDDDEGSIARPSIGESLKLRKLRNENDHDDDGGVATIVTQISNEKSQRTSELNYKLSPEKESPSPNKNKMPNTFCSPR